MSEAPNLFGRLAVHYKLVTADQLAEATRRQARDGHQRPLGDYLVELGLLTPAHVEKLLAVQREVAEKQAATAAAIAATPRPTPAATAPATRPSAPSAKRVDRLLELAFRQGASDLHLRAGEPALQRRGGRLAPLGEAPLAAPQVEQFAAELLEPGQRQRLAAEGQIDFAHTLTGLARFRGNAYRHQGGLALALRAIPAEVPTLADLGLPSTLARLTNHHQGLVLLTGPAGCGKSSTMAALLRLINEERRDHIVTIEDPIEYLHRPLRCVVNQRQVGRDTGSFSRALEAALLVLGTLHTGNAIRTVDRLVGAFPPGQQSQIRAMLSESLRAVVSQRLVDRADGAGRIPALEILVGTRATANLIRESKTFQLRSLIQTNLAHGMALLDLSLAQLVRDGVIARAEALRHAEEPKLIPGG